MKRLALLTLLIAGFATQAAAQHSQTREGFWISVGLGAGSAGASCDLCNDDRETALSGYFRLGGTVSPRLLIGAETNGWVKSEGGIDQQIGALAGVAYFYPSAAGGLFLKGGLGVMAYRADDDIDEITATGFGYQVGLGYDFRLARNFSLSPFLNYLGSVGSDAKLNGSSLGGDFNTNVFQFGLGATFH